ncbi:TPA: hypothetical protein SLP39_000746 [Proteus mirabilis]|nr:hypothetical protein [Proteus mirabilis]
MAISTGEMKAKAAEVTAELVKQHIESASGMYTSSNYKADIANLFERVYDSVIKKMTE